MKIKLFLSVLLLIFSHFIFGQIGTSKNLGASSVYKNLILNAEVSTAEKRSATPLFTLITPNNEKLAGVVNLKDNIGNDYRIVGNTSNGTFHMIIHTNGNVSGLYTSISERKAYTYTTNEITNELIVEEVDIASVICIDYKALDEVSDDINSTRNQQEITAIPKYESKPGSKYVIYIDLDGEVSNSDWNGGITIYALPRNWSSADIKTMWELVAQDFIIWDVNVTTDRAVYNAASFCNRIMCIVTSTNTAAPGAGGVAYLNSFGACWGQPCWVFNSGVKTASESISHEIGHTFGLSHDATSTLSYYTGHNDWGPIMGTAFGTNMVGQWSVGEYADANNQENDISIIGTKNGFRQKTDDVGNTMGTAKPLIIESNGNVLSTFNNGLINNRTDIDLFKFTNTSTINVNLSVKPFYKNPNLNIKVRLLNSSGNVITISDSTGSSIKSMAATIVANNLPPDTYYIEIDGVGDGADPTVGYSDYGSIGDYYISSISPLTSKPIPLFIANTNEICSGSQVTFNDRSQNGTTSWKWTFLGGTPATSNVQNPPAITYNTSGTYPVKLVVKNATATDSIMKMNYITVRDILTAPTTVGDNRCSPGLANLSASGNGDTLLWYADATSTTLINRGPNYSVNLTKSTTFYVSQSVKFAPQYVGPTDNNIYQGGFLSATDGRGLLFNVFNNCILKSVKVYANTAGDRTIQVLKNIGGTILFSKTITLPEGESRVVLNFNLTPGTQYFLKVTGALVDLYRDTGGANFPFNLSNLISITDTDAAPASPNYYYYFYDWEVSAIGCASPRSAVTGTINSPATTPIITSNGNELTSTSAINYQWYIDGNDISGANSQTYRVITNGSYNVEITNADGCKAISSSVLITSINQINQNNNFEVFPNPANGFVTIKGSIAHFKLELYDILGKTVQSQTTSTNNIKINLSEFEQGIYFYVISNENNVVQTGKLIVN